MGRKRRSLGLHFGAGKITEKIHYKGNHGILDEATSLAVLAQPVKGNTPPRWMELALLPQSTGRSPWQA